MADGEEPLLDSEMSLGDHLEELRRRVIRALLGVAAAATVMLVFGRRLVAWLCLPLIDALRLHGLEPRIEFFSPPEAFGIYLKVSLIAGLIVALPWVLYQLWRFVAVGLYAAERRIALFLAPLSLAMALLGVAFVYWVMLPICLSFFVGFGDSYPIVIERAPSWVAELVGPGADDVLVTTPPPLEWPAAPVVADDPAEPRDGQWWLKVPEQELRVRVGDRTLRFPAANPQHSLLKPNIRLAEYIGFVSSLLLGTVIAFQVPVVMLIIGWTGLVDPAFFSRYRPHFVVLCFFVGMVLTPADIMSMIVLSLPLWALFEFGVVLMRLTYRRR